MLTQERLKELLHYDPETGNFYWKVNRAKRAKVGDLAGTNNHGYIRIKIQRKTYSAHRLAWLFVHGQWPTNLTDHINGDPLDNRISNLREATCLENALNAKIRTDNTSGIKGVSFDTKGKRWFAQVWLNKHNFVKTFKLKEDAVNWTIKMREQHHGQFANHG